MFQQPQLQYVRPPQEQPMFQQQQLQYVRPPQEQPMFQQPQRQYVRPPQEQPMFQQHLGQQAQQPQGFQGMWQPALQPGMVASHSLHGHGPGMRYLPAAAAYPPQQQGSLQPPQPLQAAWWPE